MLVLQILFWVLLILSAIGWFVPVSPTGQKAQGIIVLILIAILGFKAFGGIH